MMETKKAAEEKKDKKKTEDNNEEEGKSPCCAAFSLKCFILTGHACINALHWNTATNISFPLLHYIISALNIPHFPTQNVYLCLSYDSPNEQQSLS
jgi:hypothetical protein